MTRTEIEKFNEIRLFDERDIFIKALKKTAKKMVSNGPVNEKIYVSLTAINGHYLLKI